jgi:cyclophilin family peptidyl-prolyl cis-trans isomerase
LAAVAPKPAPKAVDPVVVLHTSLGDIKLQLHADKAPETVENFIRNYAERGFYENTIVHHVQPDSMVLCGGYLADLKERETRSPIRNESFNGLKNERGMVAMTRDPEYADSATSQFFINLADNPGLDYATSDEGDPLPGYCVFGKVIAGMDIVDRIAELPRSASGPFEQVPAGPVTILTVEQVR